MTEPPFTLVIERADRTAKPVPTPAPGSSVLQLAIPSLEHGSVAVVTGPDGDLVRRIAATVRPVDVDGAGCATRLPADPGWDRPRPGPGIALEAPAAVAVCLYERDLLGASAVLTGADAAAAVRTLTSAKAGPLPDDPDSCAPEVREETSLWLHVRAADGRATEVRIHFESCRGRRVATPDGVAQVTRAQLAALINPLHVGYVFIGGLPER